MSVFGEREGGTFFPFRTIPKFMRNKKLEFFFIVTVSLPSAIEMIPITFTLFVFVVTGLKPGRPKSAHQKKINTERLSNDKVE